MWKRFTEASNRNRHINTHHIELGTTLYNIKIKFTFTNSVSRVINFIFYHDQV